MRIITWNDLRAVPWKNGQGITREIARDPDGDGFAWRLSVAEVAGDGPFSCFDGMRRILTVVDGRGMELSSRNGMLQADPGLPVGFDGSLDMTSRLKDGAVQDLNLIFNPLLCSGHVCLLTAQESLNIRCKVKQVRALYCMFGSIELAQSSQLQRGDTAFLDHNACDVRIDAFSQALLVTIDSFIQSDISSAPIAMR
jgi:uncharacterized protein